MLKDFEMIEKLRQIISERNHMPSRKLWGRADTIIKQKYEITNKELDDVLKKIIKGVGAVTLTCSTRFKVMLDIIEYALGE